MAPRERRMWLTCLTGAVWTPERRKRAGFQEHETCRMCGGSGSLYHLFWECPVTRPARENVELKLDCVPSLPRPLRLFGIVPEAIRDPLKSIWGEEGEQGQTAYRCVEATEAQRAALVEEQSGHEHCASLRDLLEAVRGPWPTEMPQVMPGPAEEAPDEPNVYTDGSLMHGSSPYQGLAGAAAVWVNRTGG
eukprot:901653-Alexandrium_andersonii.AAC.1